MIKRFFEQRRQRAATKKKERLVKRLRSLIRFFRENDNQGLLQRALWDVREVSSTSLSTGGFRDACMDVTMHDGFTITARGSWSIEALRNAAAKVVIRIREVNRE